MIERGFANFLSVVFQPIFVPLYSVFIFFNTNTHLAYAVPPAARNFIYLIISLNMVVLPIAMLVYFKKKGIISSYHIRDPKERPLPFLIILVFHASTYYLFLQMELPTVIPNMILGGAVAVLAAMVINAWWKISIHLLGMGSLVGLVIGLMMRYQAPLLQVVLTAIVISGLVGFARLRLDAHTPGQVYAGFTLGTLVMVATVLVG